MVYFLVQIICVCHLYCKKKKPTKAKKIKSSKPEKVNLGKKEDPFDRFGFHSIASQIHCDGPVERQNRVDKQAERNCS